MERPRRRVRAGLRSRGEQVRSATVLAVAGLVAGLGNLAFNVVVARQGGSTTYGAIGPLLAMSAVAGSIATASTYAVALVIVREGITGTRALRRSFRSFAPWLPVSGAGVALAGPMSSFLHLGAPLVAAATVVFCAGMIALGAPLGVLLGSGRYGVIAVLTVTTAAVRLALEPLLASVGSVLTAALVASVLSVALTLGVACMVVVRSPANAMATRASRVRERLGAESVAGSLLAAALFALWAVPVTLARHDNPGPTVGAFAAVQLMAGAVVFYIATPLVSAFFPRIAARCAMRDVARGLLVTVIASGLGSLALVAVGPTVLRVLYGGDYVVATGTLVNSAVSALAVSCAAYAVWVTRALGRLRLRAGAWLAVALACEFGVAANRHCSLESLSLAPTAGLVAGLVAVVASSVVVRTVRGLRPTAPLAPFATEGLGP